MRSPSDNSLSCLPLSVRVLGIIAALAIVTPLVGVGLRVPWGQIPTLLGGESAQIALWLSLRTALISTLVSLILGVPLALALARQWPGVGLARIVVVLPMTMPPVVAGIALLATFGRRGWLGPSLQEAGLSIAFSTTAVVLAQVFVSMPFLVVTLEAALRSRERQAERMARTLGAGSLTVLMRITLPLVAPALARGTALALGRALGEFGATLTFAGSLEGTTRTMPLAIYLERESDADTAMALAVVLVVTSALVVGLTALPGGWIYRLRTWAERQLFKKIDETGAANTKPSQLAAPASPGSKLELVAKLPERSIDNARLEVSPGQFLTLIGPNGCGKSTLCLMIAGLLRTQGYLKIADKTLDEPGWHGTFVSPGKRPVALLAQNPGIFTHMSVLDNVAFGPRCQGQGRRRARQRAWQELHAVGASHLAYRQGGELSGGQAARVALARALATSPRVLVLDEPMAALDVQARSQLRARIRERTRTRAITVVMVSHDLVDIASLSDAVAVMDAGQLITQGPTAEVLSTPSTEFVATLTGASLLNGTLAGDEATPQLKLGKGVSLRLAQWPQANDDEPAWQVGAKAVALINPDAIALYPQQPKGSPRNVIPVTVSSLDGDGAVVSLSLRLADGQRLRTRLTAAAIAELGIQAGTSLFAVIKATAITLEAR
ncbi:MAG: molybdate ABC transporter permease subunit [Actinomyces graevenitzii]|nr:molybdate ABC transporter permease subunit [Actinomyces graevenitzii]